VGVTYVMHHVIRLTKCANSISGWAPRYSTWEPEVNILDARLIHQFEKKIALDPTQNRRGRKPKTWHKDRNSNNAKHNGSSKSANSSKEYAGGSDVESEDSEESDSDKVNSSKKKSPPSVPYILPTLSGRMPKPPERYQEEDKNSSKESKSGSRHRHKSSKTVREEEEEESTDDEVTFTSKSQGRNCGQSLNI
jgi:hypothetical protein